MISRVSIDTQIFALQNLLQVNNHRRYFWALLDYISLPRIDTKSYKAIKSASTFPRRPSRATRYLFRTPGISSLLSRSHYQLLSKIPSRPFPRCPPLGMDQARLGARLFQSTPSDGGGVATPPGHVTHHVPLRRRRHGVAASQGRAGRGERCGIYSFLGV